MPFSPSSRYFTTPIRMRTDADGEEVLFLARRIIPQSSRYEFAQVVRADRDSRVDVLAAEEIGDPLLYWRVCDANGIAEPAEALEPDGRELGIPLPLSGQGGGNA